MDDKDIIRNAVRALRNSDDPELGGSMHGECSDDQIAKQKAAYEAGEPKEETPEKKEQEPQISDLPKELDDLFKQVDKNGPQIHKFPGGMVGVCTSLDDVMKLVKRMREQEAYKSTPPKDGGTFTYRYDDSKRPLFYRLDPDDDGVGKQLDDMVTALKNFCKEHALPALVMVQTAQDDENHGASCGFEWPVIERSMGAVDLVMAIHHMVIKNCTVLDPDDMNSIAETISKIMAKHKDQWE